MILSILKENSGENRVAVLPELIPQLQKLKIDVSVEHGAGDRSYASDADYISAGAKIMTRDEIFANSDIILKINLPNEADIQSLRNNTVWISILQPLQNKELIQKLNAKFATALG